MPRRRTARVTLVELMIAVALIAVYLTPLRYDRARPFDRGTLASLAMGSISLGVLVVYRRLTPWVWLLVAGYLVHPLVLGLEILENHTYWLARYEDLIFRALRYEVLAIQGLYTAGLLLVCRSVARQLDQARPPAGPDPTPDSAAPPPLRPQQRSRRSS